MRNLILLVAAVLFAPALSFAQSNYKPGYVVTLKGDTMRGFIDYREWNLNPKSINFKGTVNDVNSNKYAAADISYFNINSLESYRTYIGPVTTDPTLLSKIGSARDTSFRIDTIFLKIIETGDRLTLYSYTDEIKTRFFLKDSFETTPKELIFRTYFDSNSDTGIGTVSENTFQKQLSAEALKYNELNDALITYISKADYTADDISKIVRKINHSSKTKNSNNAKGYQFFAGAGLNITNTLPDGSRQADENNLAHTSILPFISGGINVFTNPNIRKLMFRFEMMFTGGQYKYYDAYKIYQGSFIPQMIYNFYNKANFKLYGGIGMGIDKYFYSDAFYADLKFNTSFLLTAGIQPNKHLAFYIRYVQNSLSARNTQIGLNYLFK